MLLLNGMKFLKKLKRNYRNLLSVHITEDALRHNLNAYRKMCPEQAVCPVLKSNAYGHGLTEVAGVLDAEGAPFFVVDSLYEAYELKKARIKTPILILGYNHPSNLTSKHPFHFTVSDQADIQTYADLGVPVHIEIDTGMNRMGIRMEDLNEALKEMQSRKLNVVGLFTHLADADGENNEYTKMQKDHFRHAIHLVNEAGFRPEWIHIANSAGAVQCLDIPEVNMIRLGISLYGYPPIELPEELMPALEFHSSIVSIRTLKKGEKLSYNCTFEAPKDMQVAVLACGYHEGVPRSLSNKGPFLGRVCMNHCFIEAEVGMQVGDSYPLFTLKGSRSISKIAELANTIPYEILVGLDASVKRKTQ